MKGEIDLKNNRVFLEFKDEEELMKFAKSLDKSGWKVSNYGFEGGREEK